MREAKNPDKYVKEGIINSYSDLKCTDDYDQISSAHNLDEVNSGNAIRESIGSNKQSSYLCKEVSPSKSNKKKAIQRQQKLVSGGMQPSVKRSSSQSNVQKVPSSKVYNKKSLQFKQLKYEQFQLIYRTFGMFSTTHINFNQLVLALKSLGVEMQTQKRFQFVKNIYDELVIKNQTEIDFQMFGKIAMKLWKQEKAKQNSDINNLEKVYCYMVQQGNNIDCPFQKSPSGQYLPKDLYSQFKSYALYLPPDLKYLTQDSISNLVKYLGLQEQYTQNDINNILKFADRQEKGYITFQDVIRCIELNGSADY